MMKAKRLKPQIKCFCQSLKYVEHMPAYWRFCNRKKAQQTHKVKKFQNKTGKNNQCGSVQFRQEVTQRGRS